LNKQLRRSKSFFAREERLKEGAPLKLKKVPEKSKKDFIGFSDKDTETKQSVSEKLIEGYQWFPIGSRKKARSTRESEKSQAVGEEFFRRVNKKLRGIVKKLVRVSDVRQEELTGGPLEIRDLKLSGDYSGKDFYIVWKEKVRVIRGYSKRRLLKRTEESQGIIIDYKGVEKEIKDIAILPTVVTSILKGHLINNKPNIRIEDIKIRMRAKHSKLVLIIVLDLSESMQPIFSKISDALVRLKTYAWRKRDKIGLIACSGDEAMVLVYPSTNINIIKRHFKKIVAGGRTPLASGMLKGMRILELEKRKNPDIIPLMIIITDGLANVPLREIKVPDEYYEECPIYGFGDSIYVAHLLKRRGIKAIIINPLHGYITEEFLGWNPVKLLRRINEIVGGVYIGYNIKIIRFTSRELLDMIFGAINQILA